MAKIFINYRRADANAWAHNLVFDPLVAAFGRENIFLDVDADLPPGLDFVEEIEKAVDACDIVLVIIGPRWLEQLQARDAGHVSDDDPDFVRVEIERALSRKIPVVPLLVDGADMPKKSALPNEIATLAQRQSETASTGAGLRGDTERLIERLRQGLPEPQPLSVFCDTLNDGSPGPEMMIIPSGRFMMGSPAHEPDRKEDEGPQRLVTFARPFALGRYAITFEEYDVYCAAIGAAHPSAFGWARGRHPVTSVSWDDAQGYCRWLSEQSGQEYRLPSEAEWEYACRAGATTPYAFGARIGREQANFGENEGRTVPVERYAPNAWGLHQMHGNVWEWCEDVWNDSYSGAPSDGSAWVSGNTSRNVVRGGSWKSTPVRSRSAYRGWSRWSRWSFRISYVGFRLAQTRVE